MSQLLIDLIPIFVFFLAFKLYNIYVATAALMIGTVLQLGFMKYTKRTIEKIHWVTLALVLIMGTLTLFFHDPTFIKWKPTVIYWCFALVLGLAPLMGKKNLVEHMMGSKMTLATSAWQTLNHFFVAFFALMGGLNLWVFKRFSTDIWVSYKLFGTLALTVAFSILISVYVLKLRKNNSA